MPGIPLFIPGMVMAGIGGYSLNRSIRRWMGRVQDIATGGSGEPVGDYPFIDRPDPDR